MDKLTEAAVLLKLFEIDAIVYDESNGKHEDVAPWACFKILVGPRWQRNGKRYPRRFNPCRPQGVGTDGFKQTLSYRSKDALYIGAKRLIERKFQSDKSAEPF